MIKGNEWSKLSKYFLPVTVVDAYNALIKDIVSCNWGYVVFASNKSLLFSLLVSSSDSINLSKTMCCLTNSSFFVYLREIAEYYTKNGVFPSVLFVDDVIFKGRNLNSLIARSEDHVCNEVRNLTDDEYNDLEVRESFKRAVSIRVCAEVSGKNLLLTRYSERLSSYTQLSVREWHKVSSDQMLMLAMADITNASYAYSVGVDEEIFQKIQEKENLIETLYGGNKEYTYVDVQSDSRGNVRFIFTLRFIRVIEKKKYRMIAYVMTPELGKDIRDRIIKDIQNRISNQEGFDGLGGFLGENNASYKRSQDEWISLMFSCAVLVDFCNKYDIEILEDSDDELNKLKINYARPQADVSNNLRTVIGNPVFKDMQDLRNYLWEAIDIDQRITTCNAVARVYNDKEVREKLEHLYYVREVNELKMITDLTKRNLIVLAEINGKTQFPVWLPIDYVCEGCSIEDVQETVAYFLQMMDIGMHGVYAEDKRASSKESYNAYSKAAELSLMIYPIRLYEQMVIIIAIYEHCVRNHLNFNQHIDDYSQNPFCDLKNIDDIKRFVEILQLIGETPFDWSDSYFYRMRGFDPDQSDANRILMSKKVAKDMESMERYRKYLADL